MKNPLRKRIRKELVQEAGKYIVIFIFMVATIGFVSGFLVADNSMKSAYDKGFEKYNIEDGNFEYKEKAGEKTISKIEEQDVKLYENFFTQQQVKAKSKLRIYANRDKVDRACVLKGRLPSAKGEIALDRLYANYNKYKVGDLIKTGNQKLKVVGLVSLSDYSAMFENNSDMMFDATTFGVAVVTKEQLASYGDIHYNYSWKNNESSLREKEKKDALSSSAVCSTHTCASIPTSTTWRRAIRLSGRHWAATQEKCFFSTTGASGHSSASASTVWPSPDGYCSDSTTGRPRSTEACSSQPTRLTRPCGSSTAGSSFS